MRERGQRTGEMTIMATGESGETVQADAVRAGPVRDGPAQEGTARPEAAAGFEVHLDVFEGPFDLLLGLISKHKLDITEIALSR